jgi:hypothetical protein
MKLSQPASSSDIEVARDIARRLNRHRRRDDRSAASQPPAAAAAPADEALAPPKRLRPPSPPPRLAQPRPEPAALHAAEPAAAESPAIETEVEIDEPPATPEPEPELTPSAAVRVEPPAKPSPVRFEAPPPAPRFEPPPPRVEIPEPTGEFEAEFDPEEPPAFARTAASEEDEDDGLSFGGDPEVEIPRVEDEEPLGVLAADEDAAVDAGVDDASLSPEQLVGDESADEGAAEAADASPLDQLTEVAEPSPFDDALLEEPAAGEEPVGPSWDEIVEICRALGQANGAMLVDPAGQVFAARGDWPAPGPNAIATKLVTMMEKTLKDAPTRSISAPLMGLHLTAWRVQLAEGLVTIAFIGRTPVKTEARPAIDNEIHRGTGA